MDNRNSKAESMCIGCKKIDSSPAEMEGPVKSGARLVQTASIALPQSRGQEKRRALHSIPTFAWCPLEGPLHQSIPAVLRWCSADKSTGSIRLHLILGCQRMQSDTTRRTDRSRPWDAQHTTVLCICNKRGPFVQTHPGLRGPVGATLRQECRRRAPVKPLGMP